MDKTVREHKYLHSTEYLPKLVQVSYIVLYFLTVKFEKRFVDFYFSDTFSLGLQTKKVIN